MGLFDLFKKKETKKETITDFNPLNGDNLVNYIRSNLKKPTDENVLKVLEQVTKPDDDLEHLTPDGELPWMWHSVNKEILEQLNTEYSYFLNLWLDARKKSPKEQYSALKSFVIYLEDVQKLCKQKGECFEFYFNEVLTAPGYLEARKEELHELTVNLDELQQNYYKKTTLLSVLDNEIIQKLQDNDGILQADFIKLFDECVHNEVSSKLYFMAKSGELKRTKAGRSYILNYLN